MGPGGQVGAWRWLSEQRPLWWSAWRGLKSALVWSSSWDLKTVRGDTAARASGTQTGGWSCLLLLFYLFLFQKSEPRMTGPLWSWCYPGGCFCLWSNFKKILWDSSNCKFFSRLSSFPEPEFLLHLWICILRVWYAELSLHLPSGRMNLLPFLCNSQQLGAPQPPFNSENKVCSQRWLYISHPNARKPL